MADDSDDDNVFHSPYQPLPSLKANSGSLIELLIEKSKEHAENGKTKWMTDAVTGDSYDFECFDDLTKRIGSYLYKRGMRKGDIVIFMTVDILRQPLFLGGIWRANGIGRASYPEDDAETLLTRVKESRTGWIYCEAAHAPMCLQVAEKVYWDVEVIVASKEGVEGCTSIYEVMEDDGTELPEIDTNWDDTALIMCTSGTTGLSKGAMISQSAAVWMANTLRGAVPLFNNGEYNNLICTKGTHISGAMVPLAGMISGISAIYLTFINRQTVLNAVDKFKPGFMFGFPTFLLLLVHDPEAKKLDLSNLQIIGSGGAPITPPFIKAMMSLPSVKSVVNVYGLTEVVPISSAFDFDLMEILDDRPEGSIGKLTPGTSAKFIDVDSEESVEIGKMGELCVKCDGLFSGYFLNPEATDKAFTKDGYFKTGDIGYMDEDGFVFLVDRAKEIFKYFNNHIAPTELENVILQHPAIAEVCVIGIPDPDGGGHIPRAFCVLASGTNVTPEEIQVYANERLANYKHLRGDVFFLPELPKGKTGKVTRQLVEQIKVN